MALVKKQKTPAVRIRDRIVRAILREVDAANRTQWPDDEQRRYYVQGLRSAISLAKSTRLERGS